MKFNHFLVSGFSFIVAVLCSGVSVANSETIKPTLQFNGKLWINLIPPDVAVKRQSFDVYRAFFQANYIFDDRWSSLFLLDIQREETIQITSNSPDFTVSGRFSKSPLMVYLRNAYIQADKLDLINGKVRIGYQPNPYIGILNAANKTRWLAKSLADETKFLAPDAGGFSILGMFNENFEFSIMIHNGLEDLNQHGTFDTNLASGVGFSWRPIVNGMDGIKQLGAHLYFEKQVDDASGPGSHGLYSDIEPGSETLAAAVTLESDFADVSFETLLNKPSRWQTQYKSSNGVTLSVKPLDSLSFFGRLVDGSTRVGGPVTIVSVGPSYAFIKDKVSTAFIYEKHVSVAVKSTSTLSWNWAANF